MRILVVDDHAIFRAGARKHLCDGIAKTVVDEAANGAESMARLRSCAYDVVVLDITLQGGESGFELLRRIKAEASAPPVLMLSVHTSEEYAVRSLRAGAAGYLTKECAPEEGTPIDMIGRAQREAPSQSGSRPRAATCEHSTTT